MLCADVKMGGQAQIPVHIYPAAFDGAQWAAFRKDAAEVFARHQQFWQPLEAAYRSFEKTRLIPATHVESSGRYVVQAATPAP